MCDLVHIADLPRNVADAITEDSNVEDVIPLDVDDAELIQDEWYDDEYVSSLRLPEDPLADVRRTIEVDARRHENPLTQVL